MSFYRSIWELPLSPAGPMSASPADWRDRFIYHLMIDRFDDAMERPMGVATGPRAALNPKQGRMFQGGKLRGITRRLDYIRGLGCTALLLSPPFKNRQDDPGSYHGYAVQDFSAVDPRFGTVADLRELVREAHARGMAVLLDVVINHAGNVFAYREQPALWRERGGRYEFGHWRRVGGEGPGPLGPDDGVWPVELQRPECFSRRGAIRDFGTAGELETIHGDFFGFKDLDLDAPGVMDALVRIYRYWISAADVDGLRIDTVRNMEPRACARFCAGIREHAVRLGKHNFLLLGEVLSDDATINRYIGDAGPAAGTDEVYPQFDAAFDFPLYAVLEEVLKRKAPAGLLRERYAQLARHWRDFGLAGRSYVTFLDNHDQVARPFRRFMCGQEDPRLATLGVGYLLMSMGIPCLYYGTEQGFDGGGQSDGCVREAMFGGHWGPFKTSGMHWFNAQNPIYRSIAQLAEIRRQQPALRYGRQYFRDTMEGDGRPGGMLAFSRVLGDEELVIAMNLDPEPRRDRIVLDERLTGAGMRLQDLFSGREFVVEGTEDRAWVRVPLAGREMAVLARGVNQGGACA